MGIDVSVIIVNYNCEGYLPQCLKSLYKETKDIIIEVIVVDNASTDKSLDYIRKQFPQVHIIENGKNLGFGAANNVGALVAKGNYLLLLNPDTILCNNAVKILYDNAVTAGTGIGCCGGNLLDEQLHPANIGGNFPSLFQLFSDIGFRFFYPAYYKRKVSLLSTIDNLPPGNEIQSVCGADLLIKKNVFEEMGGFDEDYFLYFEDTDLSYRLYKHGYKNYIFPDAKIMHLESAAIADNRSEKLNLKKFKYFEHGKQLFFKKTHPKSIILIVKFFTVLYIFTRWLAHKGNFTQYCRMMWIAIKMKQCY